MSVPMDVESLSGLSSSFESDTSLICGSSPSPPVTLSGEPCSAAASTPSAVCAGPSQAMSECLSLESLSRETDISATSTPSPIYAGPSQVPKRRLPSTRPLPLRGVVKCWTEPPGGHEDSTVTESNSSDSVVMELAAVCGSSSSYFMLDSDSNDGRSVVPMVDACLGDATSLIDMEDDEGDEFWNNIRVDNAGDCHLSDACSSTELNPDEGSHVPLLENTDYLNDDNSLLEAFSDNQLSRWPNTTAGNVDNASLYPVQELRVVVPTCWGEEEEIQGTAGETPERNGRVPAEQDSVQSFHLEPEPHLNVDTADAAFSSLKRHTPTHQLLQNHADGGDAAGGWDGSVACVEERECLEQLERRVEDMQQDIIRHLQMVKTQLQEGAHTRQKNRVFSFFRCLGNKCRCLGKRSRKVGPQNTTETDCTQGTKERSMAETCEEDIGQQVYTEDLQQHQKGIRAFLRRLSNAARGLRKKNRSTEQNQSERKGLRRFFFNVSCFKSNK